MLGVSVLNTGTPGLEFASENLKGATYPAGTVAMSNDGSRNSNGSQFFIVYKDSTSRLPPVYTPFGDDLKDPLPRGPRV
jgi:peptidyl-prolyl cis-trans isomerase B (cyclophilin B)